jgi:hypothetical protein
MNKKTIIGQDRGMPVESLITPDFSQLEVRVIADLMKNKPKGEVIEMYSATGTGKSIFDLKRMKLSLDTDKDIGYNRDNDKDKDKDIKEEG